MTGTLEQATQTATATARRIRKAVVLGAGIMGSRIACHFANIGLDVVLLDIVPRELNDAEKAKGLTLESPQVRNRIVNDLLQVALKTNPKPLYDESWAKRIVTGNFDDHMHLISDADWVVEVVVERLDIKKNVYDLVEKHRKPGTLITTNTSGIPMWQLVEGRSDDFKQNFCGTHFFNPPRYLPLLEIIPAPETDPAVIEFLMDYGSRFLGKKTVFCKDTPAFIANRVGIYSIMDVFHNIIKHDLTVTEVDKLTGPIIGNPGSATFRTADLVGLDTAVKVAQGIYDNCPNDERRDLFTLPEYLQKMVDGQMWGDKTGKGFYQKTKTPEGKKEILALNLKTLEYAPQAKFESESYKKAKNADNPAKALVILSEADDKYGAFMRDLSYGLASYVSYRIPEITDTIYSLDDALRAGFGWKFGPFERWDILGVAKTVDAMKAAGYQVADWVHEFLAAGNTSFYKVEAGQKLCFNPLSKSYEPIPGGAAFLNLNNLRPTNTVWKNEECSIIDLGDGIINIEFHSKMNTLGEGVLKGLNHGIDLAEAKYRGVVVSNLGDNFSVGANLFMVTMMIGQGAWDQLEMATKYFQDTVMRLRYSDIPVVLAPHQFTFGGACEMSMHADVTIPHAETYMGLVEVGVGVLPGGAGTKEFALRMSDRYRKGDVDTNILLEALMTIGTAKVATSAQEAFNLGYLLKHKDKVAVNRERQLADAKRIALLMAEQGYTRPVARKDIRVLGRVGLGMVEAGVYNMQFAGYASEHDRLITSKIGYVLCGGDVSEAAEVSEQYLLDIEREAFLFLCGTEKTQARITHMLSTGKPLRN